jgi:hypothetical protein
MLNDPKSAFKYRPSYDTDIRRTFARIKREAKQQQTPPPTPAPTATPAQAGTHVVPMRKRGGA